MTTSHIAIHKWQALRAQFASISATAALDARLLVEHVLGGPLHQNEQRALSQRALAQLNALARRRCAGEPIARLFGQREFYGLPFAIGPAVLDPRPETELLVDQALKHMNPQQRFLELGTGSGCIAIALARHSGAQGLAVDCSPAALRLARANARRHQVTTQLRFRISNWFESVRGRFDIIISNPPYIAHSEWAALAPDVRCYDPAIALQAGEDGLACLHHILRNGAQYLAPAGILLLEHGHTQAPHLKALAAQYGWHVQGAYQDLAGWGRVLELVKKNTLDKA